MSYSLSYQKGYVGVERLKVRVQHLGYIRNMLRKGEDEFELGEGAFLSDLLNKLVGIYGEAFRREFFEFGFRDVKTGFVVTVNGF